MRRLACAATLALACACRERAPGPRRVVSGAGESPAPSPKTNLAPARALAFGYGGRARVQFDARRLDGEHTLSLWFLAAYDAAGRQILLSDESGHYHVGLAPYAAQSAVALELTLGGSTLTAPLLDPHLSDNDFRNGAPEQTPLQWRHLALSVRGQRAGAWLDGRLLAELDFERIDAQGALLFGQLPQSGELRDQYYGLIDDVALFDQALEAPEIRALAQHPKLAPTLAHLLAAWTFDEDASAALTGAAALVAISREHDARRDLAALPPPATSARFQLPFAADQVWLVIQGNNSGLSHHDEAAFALDFLRVAPAAVEQNPERVPGASHALSLGQPILAAAAGEVVAVVDCYSDDNRGSCGRDASSAHQALPALELDPAHRNLVCLRHGQDEYSCYLHLQFHSATVRLGQQVRAGDTLGRVGQTGARKVHLHFAVSNASEANLPGAFTNLVTLPFEFHDYSVSNDFGQSWRYIEHGAPTPGQWLVRGRLPAHTPVAHPDASAPR